MTVAMSMSEMRAQLPRVLDQVEAGEEVTVTRHGRPVAVLVRPDRLRVRRNHEVLAAADDLGRRIEEAREKPLGRPVLTVERAEELVEEIRADRDAR